MIHSLLGQSEVLTLSGVYMYINNHTSLGICLMCLGVIAAGIRYSANMGLVSKHMESENLNDNKQNRLLKEHKTKDN